MDLNFLQDILALIKDFDASLIEVFQNLIASIIALFA